MIISDVHLLAAIHKAYPFPYFKWRQLGDPMDGNIPSFLARHIRVWYFVMLNQIESMMDEQWKTSLQVCEFDTTLEELSNEEVFVQKMKVKHLL